MNLGAGGRPDSRPVSPVGVAPLVLAILLSLSLQVEPALAVSAAHPVGLGDSPMTGEGATSPAGLALQQASPTAELSVSPTPAHPGELVTLDASASSSSAGDVACDFDYEGDGNFDVFGDQDCVVTHTYTQTGSYQPTVLVRDANQATDTASSSLSVVENEPPEAAFDASPTEVGVDEDVTFDASSSSDPDGSILTYRWDFDNDGTFDASTSNAVISHSYDAAGSYAVTLQVEDDDGATDTGVFQSITVTANQPPTASFAFTPTEPTVGQLTTFDASDSSDPDGTIVTYRWDFDNDGIYDVETADETVGHTFDESGTEVVTLQVEDDDGATDVAQTQLVVDTAPSPASPTATSTTAAPQASCTVSPEAVSPGEPVVIDASGIEQAAVVEFDTDGDGTYERRDRDDYRVTIRYEATGTFEVRVRATGPNGQTTVFDCGSVTVTDGNEPPIAAFEHERADPDAETAITFDASASSDPDGTIVVYRWDFDDDGFIDATSSSPVITHVYAEIGTYEVSLEVEDDDGATDATTNPVELSRDGVPVTELLIVLIGLVGGLVLCRGLGFLGGFRGRPPRVAVAGSGVTDYTAGVFTLRADGGDVTVDGIGFEPDLVHLTASNAAVTGDATEQVAGTTDGWSYGAARRSRDGSIEQHAIAVADDAAHPDIALAAGHADRAVNLTVSDPLDGVAELSGRVEQITDDGFELSVDQPDNESNEPPFQPVVLYRAFELDSPGDAGLGHVQIPSEPGQEHLDLGVPADHVTLVATNGIGSLDETVMVDGPLGVSVGEVTGPGEPRQSVTAGSFIPGSVGRTVTAAADDRAVHLPELTAGPGSTSTKAVASRFEDGDLTLDFDSIAMQSGAAQPPPPGVVAYVALHAGAGRRPAMGHFALPSPAAEDVLAIDTGFAPGMVEFTVVDLDELGEQSITSNPFAFGRSHGVAVIGAEGSLKQYRISGVVDPDRPAEGLEDAAGTSIGPDGEVLVADAAGVGLAADGAGPTITGRDDVTVTAFRAGGFDVRVTDVSADGRDPARENETLVFYTAWPRPDR